MEKPSFGKPLEEHLLISGREIAFPIEACVTMLLECGMQEEVGLGTAELCLEQVSSSARWSLWGLLCYCPRPTPQTQTHEDAVQLPFLKPVLLSLMSLRSPGTVVDCGK